MPTYAEVIAEKLTGKLVEVYLGEVYEQMHYQDNSNNIPAVIIGKIIESIGDCLIIDCIYLDDKKEKKFGNLQYINAYNIRSITEVDGHGSIKDVFDSSASIKNLNKFIK